MMQHMVDEQKTAHAAKTIRTVRTVRPGPEHERAWNELYAGYATFYRVAQTQAMRDEVWRWINDQDEEIECLLAIDSTGDPVGLAHFREFARPLAASRGCYLDDLFVTPTARGSGAAEQLFEALESEARDRNWSVIRWITADDNYRARSFYDRTAHRTQWVTYDLIP